MKKAYLLAFSASLMMLTMAHKCHHEREDNPIHQTIEQTIAPGGSFTVALPGDEDDNYRFTQPAAHAAASTVEKLSYSYTAAAGFSGDDQIILTATESHKGRGGHHGGNCGGSDPETEAVVTVNVHIVASESNTLRQGK